VTRDLAGLDPGGPDLHHQGGKGGRKALLERFADAVEAIPASIELSAPA
jgi:hypothetical protein